jgi:oligosaccharide repeat unit polymerase
MYFAHLTFIVTAATAASSVRLSQVFRKFSLKGDDSPDEKEIFICFIVFLFSVLVTIVYYYLVGYNMIVLFMEGGLSDNYSDLRLAMYSGDEYFAPGYVNQFKNVLLPLSAVIIGLRLWERRRMDMFVPFIAVAIPGVIIALGGTGQRAYLIYTLSALAFGYFLHMSGRPSRVKWRPIVIASIPLVVLFVGLTAVYSESTGISDILDSTFSRFTRIQQEGGLFAFQYVYRLPIAWFSEWWENIRGLAPGIEGSPIAHDVHAMLYGTDRGTVPLTSIGSAYYNGGVIGVMLLFVILGVSYVLMYYRYLSGSRSYTRSFSYGFAFFYLSINVTDAPTVLLENGVLTVLLFIALLRVARDGPARRVGLGLTAAPVRKRYR